IFPPKTGKDLAELTKNFEKFTETLKPSPLTLVRLKHTFRGLFAVLDIGKQLVVGIGTVFAKFFGALGDGSSGFLALTARIGDWLGKLDESLKKGDKLKDFFILLANVMAVPARLIGALGRAIGKLFAGFDEKASAGMSKSLDS